MLSMLHLSCLIERTVRMEKDQAWLIPRGWTEWKMGSRIWMIQPFLLNQTLNQFLSPSVRALNHILVKKTQACTIINTLLFKLDLLTITIPK